MEPSVTETKCYWLKSKLSAAAFRIVKTNDIADQVADFSKPFNLTTDASNIALGAVLSQGPIGNDKPIAYASRTLNTHEQNYSTIEKELLDALSMIAQPDLEPNTDEIEDLDSFINQRYEEIVSDPNIRPFLDEEPEIDVATYYRNFAEEL
ncbi:hypothetical protein M8J77_024058 [Diaphorina citri]|nr:hypothetical protein M8J77_024058 [Diaphorina citri]